eukprot:TRINITY_DN759_c2_g1_i1.p1 TRINITY_DN759_c2_g1~~TRINITY_DN759_c2_g1_i1.p1  ORF type:complete len:645 (+),score=25.42 TRINITY_DN759_c2_g1_i1:160-2094(+)
MLSLIYWSHKMTGIAKWFRLDFSTFPACSYLETSSLPTLFFQPHLLQLPIPNLSISCQFYLTAVKPLLSHEQYEHLENLVRKLQTEGQYLQRELVSRNKRNKQTSYITKPWTDRYLVDRSSVVLTHNAFLGLMPDLQTMDPLKRAAKMISIIARFKASLLDGQLKPMVIHTKPKMSETDLYSKVMKFLPGSLKIYTSYLYYKAYPLDMVQFTNLFNSTRIPMPEKDILVSDSSARHICVAANGNFYTFDVFLQDGSILSIEDIFAHLIKIKQESLNYPNYPVSILTAADRDTWAEARAELVQDSSNAKSLELIDNSLFLLCLDSEESNSASEYTKAMLHGDGINRWFDKSFQLIFQPNGHCGLHFEHSWGDGVALLRLVNALHEYSNLFNFEPQKLRMKYANINKIAFTLTDKIKQTIVDVKPVFSSRTEKLRVQEIQTSRAGKLFLKKVDLSSDAFIHLAIQMAYFLVSDGKTAPTYESASTSAFKHGRTETVRPCTNETLKCTKAILTGKLSTQQHIRQMRACSERHSYLVKQALMGKGFDRHFFGLACLANELGGPVPELFTDEIHKYVNHFTLSTSTLNSEAVLLGGFAPVVDNGFGIGYRVRNEGIEANISSYESNDLIEFTNALSTCINTLLDLLHQK